MSDIIDPPSESSTAEKLHHYMAHFCNSPKVFKKLNPDPSNGVIYQIRPAQKNFQDAQILYEMVVELAIYEEMRQDVSLSVEDMYKNIIDPAAPLFYLIAEEIDTGSVCPTKKAVGYSIGYLGYSTWRSFYLYVEDIYVKESYRGKKLGLSLIYLNIISAQHSDIPFVRWQVLDWNTPSIEFYKGIGCNIETMWYNCNIYERNFDKFLNSY